MENAENLLFAEVLEWNEKTGMKRSVRALPEK